MQSYQGKGAAFYDLHDNGLWGDVDFYVEEASAAGGLVLEIGCGTGRILTRLADAGLQVVGLDNQPEMLARAQKKLQTKPDALQQRVSLLQGDLRSLDLPQRFQSILIPHRTFMHILEPKQQREALTRIYQHLQPGGRLLFNIATPPLEHMAAHTGPGSGMVQLNSSFKDPHSGRQVLSSCSCRYDPSNQHIEQYNIFDELSPDGEVLQRSYSPLHVRYTHRFEMQYLLELTGFSIIALYGDFSRRPYRYPNEQIWIAQRDK